MMDVQGFLIISLLGLLDLTPGMSILYQDKSFELELSVHNRTVRCSGKSSGKHYDAPMYTCHNISVDGSPVFHGYNDYSDDDPLFRDYSIEINNNGCPECPCGRYEHEPMDIYALCEAMLKASNIKSALQSAYVRNPVCTQKIPEERVKYFLVDGKPKWLTVRTANGYVGTLQCLTSS